MCRLTGVNSGRLLAVDSQPLAGGYRFRRYRSGSLPVPSWSAVAFRVRPLDAVGTEGTVGLLVGLVPTTS